MFDLPINAVFENAAGQALGTRAFTSPEQVHLRAVTEHAREVVSLARAPQATKVARWLGVLSPMQNNALHKGVDIIYRALDTRPVTFVTGRPSESRTLRHGGGIVYPWMTSAAFGSIHSAGTYGGRPIRIALDVRFFGSSPKHALQMILHEMSHSVLGTADINWSPLGMAYHVTLAQQLAAQHPGWALQNAENWGFYLSGYAHDWP
jgi:hypothetical protein